MKVILKMLWIKLLHPNAHIYINVNNIDKMKDVLSFTWYPSSWKDVEYKYNSICIEVNYEPD